MPEFRLIPAIERMRQRSMVAALEHQHGHAATIAALREAADDMRRALAAGAAYADADAVAHAIERAAQQRLDSEAAGTLRPVVNATGVIVHTNLGRAPLSAGAVRRVEEVATGACNLEYDVARGARGSRASHAAALLTALTGAEAATVVNNNAAATLIILAAIGAGREVVISRGELVEIGGGFRVPDVMAQSGATLREVGTTNRTRVADYRAAISARTALLLRVHPSNFRIDGFTERPALADLVAAAHDAGFPLVEDLGSGNLDGAVAWEPTVQQSIRAGVDLVCFSGDKMLGGPQAGIIVGRRDLVERVQRHPLMRAVRVDKMTLAALEGTLLDYRSGRARTRVPVLRMMHASLDEIRTRAERIARDLQAAGWNARLVQGESAVGGGSAPAIALPTVLIALERGAMTADALEERLRRGRPPIIARILADRVVLDLRSVLPEQDDVLSAVLLSI